MVIGFGLDKSGQFVISIFQWDRLHGVRARKNLTLKFAHDVCRIGLSLAMTSAPEPLPCETTLSRHYPPIVTTRRSKAGRTGWRPARRAG
jgi:hypothetical protein